MLSVGEVLELVFGLSLYYHITIKIKTPSKTRGEVKEASGTPEEDVEIIGSSEEEN